MELSLKATRSSTGCPCCTFFLGANLFLPQSEKVDENTKFDRSIHERSELDANSVIDPKVCLELILQQQSKSQHQDVDVGSRSDFSSLKCVLVDTHGHPHLNGETQPCYRLSLQQLNEQVDSSTVVSLTCAVQQSDWVSCLEYVSQSDHRMAAIGIHPWYLSDLNDTWLQELENLVVQHPGCMVGEIGLCKMARFVRTYEHGKQAALQLQRSVFTQQLKLAAKYRRPVSIHCVDQHGVLLETLRELDPDSELPPAMALHSFTGTAHQVQQLLRWEEELFQRRIKKCRFNKKHEAIDPKGLNIEKPLLYFGFSHIINYGMCSSEKSKRQGRETIRMIPRNRLLVESDVHCHDNVAAGTAGAVAYVAWALDESIIDIANLTRMNGLLFLQRLSIAANRQSHVAIEDPNNGT